MTLKENITTISNTKQAFMNVICILTSLTMMAPPLVDSKILFSLIFSLNVHVSIFLFHYYGLY